MESAPEVLARILLVEDEPKIAALVGDYLQSAGYGWQWVADGREVIAIAKAQQPDLILLDLMLPGRDGLDI